MLYSTGCTRLNNCGIPACHLEYIAQLVWITAAKCMKSLERLETLPILLTNRYHEGSLQDQPPFHDPASSSLQGYIVLFLHNKLTAGRKWLDL